MPCTYYTPEEERQLAYRAAEAQTQKVNELTALLCETMKIVSTIPHLTANLSPELQAWWADHQERDKERLRREKQERKAAQLAQKKEELQEREVLAKLIKKYGATQ